MSITVGKSVARVDAFDKVTGRTKYYEDRMPAGALYIRIKHAEIAHGFVKSVDTAAAETIDGVVKVLTCFDVPDIPFPTAGHPWSMDPGHQDVADRHLLNRHVRYYGDDVAVVIAENEVAAMQGVRALKVEYEELPFVLDVQKAMEPDAPQIHENYPGNILKHTDIRKGDYAAAIQEPGLVKVEGWYETPTVQHCHIENHGCYAYEENGRVVVVSSTQIPHIIRRIVGQALGRPWADIEIIKPYIGGGFGNKQDALYEPLCAWCSTQVNGRCVRIDCSREETFVSNRVRHAIRFHIVSWLRKDGQLAARKVECFSNQGAYASHGHSICAKALGSFAQIYPCDHMECDGWTVFTNRPAAGAMRGYGMPQASFADEANIDECAAAVGMDPDEGTERLTFGILDLCDGIPLMPLALGLMAVSELFRQSETSFFRYFRGLGLQEHVAFSTGRPEDEHLSWKEYKSLLPTIFRSTGIGSLIGILPGIGTSVASYLSYVVAKRRSKHPEKFGTGVLEGVASCEAGNNAVNGPNLIPLVTLGIPGNLAAALILGGLMVKGLTPGPTFMENQAPMLYALFTVMLFSNIFTFLFGKLAIRYAHKMTSISPSALHGNILILCAMGCYVSQNSAFALLIMFTFAVVGYIFLRLKLSLPVFLVAYILGSMLEHKLRQSLALSDGDFTIFLTRPISATFLALTVICTLYFLFRKKSASGKAS